MTSKQKPTDQLTTQISTKCLKAQLGITDYRLKQILSVLGHPEKQKRLFSSSERFLNQQHIDWLTSEETLERMRGVGLRERCCMFEREFPGKKLSFSMLRQVYQAYKIKQRILSKRLFLTEQAQKRQV